MGFETRTDLNSYICAIRKKCYSWLPQPWYGMVLSHGMAPGSRSSVAKTKQFVVLVMARSCTEESVIVGSCDIFFELESLVY